MSPVNPLDNPLVDPLVKPSVDPPGVTGRRAVKGVPSGATRSVGGSRLIWAWAEAGPTTAAKARAHLANHNMKRSTSRRATKTDCRERINSTLRLLD